MEIKDLLENCFLKRKKFIKNRMINLNVIFNINNALIQNVNNLFFE